MSAITQMPKRILIIGILFCINGLFALWGIVSDFMQSGSVFGELVIDTTTVQVFSLVIGIGLLMGRQWSQWWARLLIVVAYIFCLTSVIIAIISPEKIYISWFGQSYAGNWKLPLFLTLTALLIIVLGCMHWLLYSQKATMYFRRLD